MKKLYTAESLIEVAHLKNILENAGIQCQLKNDRLMGALGEIPFLECWPQIWVNDSDLSRARAILDEVLAPAPEAPSWRCPSCGEDVEGQFEVCWNCGAVASGI